MLLVLQSMLCTLHPSRVASCEEWERAWRRGTEDTDGILFQSRTVEGQETHARTLGEKEEGVLSNLLLEQFGHSVTCTNALYRVDF